MALAFDDAKKNLVRKHKAVARPERNPGTLTRFFGSPDNPDLPHAVLNQRDTGSAYINRTHFHIRDQFQVFIDGKGKLGRHDLPPNCVHFPRAYTPYGPLVSDASTGFTFFAMRAHLVLNFPQLKLRAVEPKAPSASGFKKWHMVEV